MDLNPFVPLGAAITQYHETKKGHCCTGKVTIYFVIWKQPDWMDYSDAENKCKELDANLIMPETQEKLSLLENILLGHRYDGKQSNHISPMRLYSLAGIYLGNRVSVKFNSPD